MRQVKEILRRESPLTLAREAVWRATRRWKQFRFDAYDRNGACPVRFESAGYYRVGAGLDPGPARDDLLPAANAIYRGEFLLLGFPSVQLGSPPPWNLDYISSTSWPQIASRRLCYIKHDGSDVKVPWELSRLQFLPVLAKAWVLTGHEEYRSAAKELLSDWIAKNPTNVGVNWTIAMEAALRSVSICLLLELLSPFRSDEEQWLERVTQALWHHFLYIHAHNEFSYLMRSNHYLTNLLGLFVLSSFLRGAGMQEARASYAQRFQEEILHQTNEDGGGRESSLGYQVFVYQAGVTAMLLMRAQQMELQSSFVTRLCRTHGFLSTLADAQARIPQVGDCDDGRVELLSDDFRRMILPPAERDSLVVAGLLEWGGTALGDSLESKDVLHGLGTESTPSARTLETSGLSIFPESGIACSHRTNAQVFFFAMPNGIDGRGSHTHNDKLSVVVRVEGHDLLCDSGTGCYTRDFRLRNMLRSTRAHNTLMVDGIEQNSLSLRKEDVFRLGNEAQVSLIEVKRESLEDMLRASHFGYQEIGVVHTRTIRILGNRLLRIEDQLSGAGEHEIDLFFQLAPKWQTSVLFDDGCIAGCTLVGPQRVTIDWEAEAPLQVEQLDAVQSRAYGALVKSQRIRVSTRARVPFQITSTIAWS